MPWNRNTFRVQTVSVLGNERSRKSFRGSGFELMMAGWLECGCVDVNGTRSGKYVIMFYWFLKNSFHIR